MELMKHCISVQFKINQIRSEKLKSITYSLDRALSNIYLEVIIQCLEPKILCEKVEFLF